MAYECKSFPKNFFEVFDLTTAVEADIFHFFMNKIFLDFQFIATKHTLHLGFQIIMDLITTPFKLDQESIDKIIWKSNDIAKIKHAIPMKIMTKK